MKISSSRGLLILSLLVLCTLTSLNAQVNTATVSGTVTDSTGAVIPGATVNLENPLTGLTRIETSDASGRFTFPFVPIGTYSLKSEHAGFQSATVVDVQVVASMSLDLSVKMMLGTVQSSVAVNGNEEGLQTTTSLQRSTLSEAQLNQLPVAHQNWVNLLALDPSVSLQGAIGSGIIINGLPPSGYNVTVDGTNATSDPEFNAYNVYGAPNIINTVGNDAIAEVSMVKGIAPATIGGTMSGNINIVTKSGTNRFHGSAYEINEVSIYDARNQFLTSRPQLTFNQYGGNVGGYILRNKLFFFVNYEGAKSYSKTAISGTVPSPYLESISPAVYSSLFAIYPSIPQPASPTALVGTYSGASSQIQKDGSGLIRIDDNINAANQIAVRYIRARPQESMPSVNPSNPQTYSGHTDAVNATYLHIGKLWTSNTRFGFNQIKLTRLNPGYNLGLNSLTFDGFGKSSATSSMFKAFFQHGNYTTYEETIAFVKGKHSIEFGGIVQRQYASRYLVQTPGMSYSSLSDFLANIPSTVILELYALPKGQPSFGLTNYQYGGYLQDDYRAAHNLTLNLGIRYDYYTVAREAEGRLYNRGVDPSNPQLGAGFGPYRSANSLFDADYKGMQPRIGFAWQPNDGTVVHGGFGTLVLGHSFYSGPSNLIQASATLPFDVVLNRTQGLNAGLNYPIDPSSYPQQVAQLQQAGVLSSDLPNATIPAHNPNSYSIDRFFGIQQSFPWRVDLTLDYVGTAGRQLGTYDTENLPGRLTGIAPEPTFGEFMEYGVGVNSEYNALQAKVAKRTGNGLNIGAAYTYAKDLAYGDAILLLPSRPQDNDNIRAEYGPTLYDMRHNFKMQAIWDIPFGYLSRNRNRVDKLIADGWQISAIFTGSTGLPANISNSGSSYPADRPDPNPAVNPYLSGSRAFPGVHQFLNPQAFIKVPTSTASGAQIRGGYLGHNAMRSPGFENLDLSLAKTFAITEGVKFLLRGDAFDSFNHTNLGGLQANVASATFGQLTSATARTVQITGRISF